MINFTRKLQAVIDRKLIAQNITNLTDARYFAAWGVKYMSFNMKTDSPYFIPIEKIQEIKDWVEGPGILIESDSIEFTDVSDGHILDNIYSSLPMSKSTFYRIPMSELKKGLPSGHYILQLKARDIKEFNTLDESVFSEIDLYIDISDLPLEDIDFPKDFGLVIQGGEEEKTGIKSFDELDDLYHLLID